MSNQVKTNGSILQTLNDRVIVRPDPDQKETKSGIVLPDIATKERTRTGLVLAANEQFRDPSGNYHPMPVKVGQRVMYMEYSGLTFVHEGERLISLFQDELFCAISDK